MFWHLELITENNRGDNYWTGQSPRSLPGESCCPTRNCTCCPKNVWTTRQSSRVSHPALWHVISRRSPVHTRRWRGDKWLWWRWCSVGSCGQRGSKRCRSWLWGGRRRGALSSSQCGSLASVTAAGSRFLGRLSSRDCTLRVGRNF